MHRGERETLPRQVVFDAAHHQRAAVAVCAGAQLLRRQPQRAHDAGVQRALGIKVAQLAGYVVNAGLVETLRAWRLAEAKKRRVPAFRVLTNRALVAVAEARPTSSQALLSVKGLGPKVVQQSGRQLIELCSRG